jgi:hypothetical protein
MLMGLYHEKGAAVDVPFGVRNTTIPPPFMNDYAVNFFDRNTNDDNNYYGCAYALAE